MFQANETTGKRIEQLHIAKRIGQAEHQRHQHDGNNEHENRRTIEPGFGPVGKTLHCRLAGAVARGHGSGAMGIGHD
ncbi:hypothetical protein D3C72_1804420 [compost metagenome]